MHPNKEDWDPDYTPKSRKYYLVGLICLLLNIVQYEKWFSLIELFGFKSHFLFETPQFSTLQHDDRERETDPKCTDNRGRGGFSRGRARFIIRKATSGHSYNSPKWAQEKLGITVEHGAEPEKELDLDRNSERDPAGKHS